MGSPELGFRGGLAELIDRFLVERLRVRVRGEQGLRAGKKPARQGGPAGQRTDAQAAQRITGGLFVPAANGRLDEVGQNPRAQERRIILIYRQRVVQGRLVAAETEIEGDEGTADESGNAEGAALEGLRDLPGRGRPGLRLLGPPRHEGFIDTTPRARETWDFRWRP